jgi:hypothetical protein
MAPKFSVLLGTLLLFKNDLAFYFKAKGKQLVYAEFDEKLKVDYSDAIVTGRCLDGRKEEKLIKVSLPYPNTTSNDIEEKWSYTVSYEKGSEQSRTKGSGWSVGAELAPCLEVFGFAGSPGSFGIFYDRHKEVTTTRSEVKTIEEQFDRTVYIPPKSIVIAKHVQVTQKFKCDVQSIVVSFNPKKKIKCMVRTLGDTKEKTEEKEIELYDFLANIGSTPTPNRNEVVHRTVSANYEWNEKVDKIRFDTVES